MGAISPPMGIGFGQSWVNVLASRALNVTYYNTTGRAICVCIYGTGPATTAIGLTVDGVECGGFYSSPGSGAVGGVSFAVVPPGSSYVAVPTGGPTVNAWSELRG